MTWCVLIFMQQHGLFRQNQSQSPFKIGAAERKLLIVFCYYVVLAVISLTSFTMSTRDASAIATHTLEYFLCEQGGHNPETPCSRAAIDEMTDPVISTMSYILLGLFPIVNLVYALNVQELKEHCRWCRKGVKFIHSDAPSTASSAVNSSTMKRV